MKVSLRCQLHKLLVLMVHDVQSKRKLGDIWAQLLLSTCVLLVPPLGMAAGVMYLSSPPQGLEQQVSERADMPLELAANHHSVIAEQRTFDETPSAVTQIQMAKDPTRYERPAPVQAPPTAVIADLSAKVPEQLPAAARRSAGRAATALPAVEEAPPATSASPAARANRTGTWVVQLSAQRTEEEAQSAFRMAQAKYSVLVGYQLRIRRKDQGERGTFYAAQVGPLARDEANGLCNRIKSAGGNCFIQASPE